MGNRSRECFLQKALAESQFDPVLIKTQICPVVRLNKEICVKTIPECLITSQTYAVGL
jgi:hypothetical protein